MALAVLAGWWQLHLRSGWQPMLLGSPQRVRPYESVLWRSAKLGSPLLLMAWELVLCASLLPCSGSHQCIAMSG